VPAIFFSKKPSLHHILKSRRRTRINVVNIIVVSKCSIICHINGYIVIFYVILAANLFSGMYLVRVVDRFFVVEKLLVPLFFPYLKFTQSGLCGFNLKTPAKFSGFNNGLFTRGCFSGLSFSEIIV